MPDELMTSAAPEALPLCIPERALDQHLVVLGKTGSGKSSALRHLVEYLLARGKRACVLDPKGDWFGLKVGADGRSPGLSVIAFGDFKDPNATDVPINAQSGARVAELIAGGNRPAIIGFRGWRIGDMIRFYTDFAQTLFAENAGELFLVGDEFHNFAPKGKVLDPQAGLSLHWSNRLLSEGRGLGLVCLIASQRPQKVHNDTLTSCETLVAMRVIHKSDRDAVRDWVDGAGDAAKGREVLEALAGLPRGEAFAWSPEIAFGPERVKFPLFVTFDSFAPPQTQKKVARAGWASVNLDEVKQKLAAVIEERKANDPAELRKQIAELNKQIAAKPAPPPTPPRVVDRPVVTHKQLAMMAKLAGHVEAILGKVEAERSRLAMTFDVAVGAAQTLRGDLEIVRQAIAEGRRLNAVTPGAPATVVPPAGEPLSDWGDGKRDEGQTFSVTAPANGGPVASRSSPSGPLARRTSRKRVAGLNQSGIGSINATQLRILAAVAWWHAIGVAAPSRPRVAFVARIKPSGGHFSNSIGPLITGGMLENADGGVRLTDAGRGVAPSPPEGERSLEAYHAGIREILATGAQRTLFDAIVGNRGVELSVAFLGESTGINPAGGHFSNSIGPLGTLGLIERRQGVVFPTELLFPKGLS